jgi:hypothetical protein
VVLKERKRGKREHVHRTRGGESEWGRDREKERKREKGWLTTKKKRSTGKIVALCWLSVKNLHFCSDFGEKSTKIRIHKTGYKSVKNCANELFKTLATFTWAQLLYGTGAIPVTLGVIVIWHFKHRQRLGAHPIDDKIYEFVSSYTRLPQ